MSNALALDYYKNKTQFYVLIITKRLNHYLPTEQIPDAHPTSSTTPPLIARLANTRPSPLSAIAIQHQQRRRGFLIQFQLTPGTLSWSRST